LIAEKI